MTSPRDDAAHRRALAAQEIHTYRTRSLWALTIVGVIIVPALFAAVGTFTAFFFIWSPPGAAQITQGAVIILVGTAIQLIAAVAVFVGAAKTRLTAHAVVTATWLLVSAGAIYIFFSNAARLEALTS